MWAVPGYKQLLDVMSLAESFHTAAAAAELLSGLPPHAM